MSTNPQQAERAAAARLMRRLGEFGAATLHESLGRSGELPHEIKPVAAGMKICGPAFTVDAPPGSNLALHHALYAAAPGDVLVVGVRGGFDYGYWGEIMTHAAIQRGLAGLVIDGCVRDAELLERLRFPVFARGLCIRGTEKYSGGSLGRPLVLGRTLIQSGDVIVGDRDGVVAVPQALIAATIDNAGAREKKEQAIIQGLAAGDATLALYNFPKM